MQRVSKNLFPRVWAWVGGENNQHSNAESGFLVLVDSENEKLLPWWLGCFRNHHETTAISAFCFDISDESRKTLETHQVSILVPGDGLPDVSNVSLLKPFALSQSPYEWTILCDLHCEVRGDVSHFLPDNKHGIVVGTGEIPTGSVRKLFREQTYFSDGFIALNRCNPFLESWSQLVLESHQSFSFAEGLLNLCVYQQEASIESLSKTEFQTRNSDGPHTDSSVVYWINSLPRFALPEAKLDAPTESEEPRFLTKIAENIVPDEFQECVSEIAVLIPCSFRISSPIRRAHGIAVIQLMVDRGFHVIVANQGTENPIGKSDVPPQVDFLDFPKVQGPSAKAFLCNRMAERAAKLGFRWAWQLDADIIPDLSEDIAFFRQNSTRETSFQVWRQFQRLNKRDSERYLNNEEIPVRKKERGGLTAFAGGFFLRLDIWLTTGGFVEDFVGWGCEDKEFMRRIEELQGHEILRGNSYAVHLFHENDRQIDERTVEVLTRDSKWTNSWDAQFTNLVRIAKTRFVLHSPPRSGSRALADALHQHTDIHFPHGEFFTHNCQFSSPKAAEVRGALKLEEITSWLIDKGNPLDSPKSILGMRVLHHQPMPSWNLDPFAFRHRLLKDGWRFLHLKRKNKFEWLCSWLLAVEQNNWLWKEYDSKKKITANFRKAEQAVRDLILQEQEFERHFGGDLIHTLYFEDLLEDWNGTIRKILPLIEAGDETLPPTHSRQKQRPWADYIENYTELELRFGHLRGE